MILFFIFTLTKLFAIQILQQNSFKGISFIDLAYYSKQQDQLLKITLETIKYDNKDNQPFLFICQYEPTDQTFIEMLKTQSCFVDWFSYELMKTQTLVIVFKNVEKQLSYYNIYQMNSSYFIGYQSNTYTNIIIKIRQLTQGECLYDCQNQSTCDNSICNCQENFIGQDCSQIAEDIQTQTILSRGKIYFYNFQANNSEDFVLNFLNSTSYSIQCIVDDLNPYLFETLENNSIQLSSQDYYKCQQRIQNISLIFSTTINYYYLIKFNSNDLIYLNTDSNNSDNSILIIVLSTILSAIIICIIFCFIKAKCKPNLQDITINSINQQNNPKIEIDNTKYIIDKYFLSQEYGQLKNRHSKHLSMNQCLICLEFFNDNCLIRVTYCNHIFHTQCFDQWMNVHKVQIYNKKSCPNCRSLFDIDSILKQYASIASKDELLQWSSRMDDAKTNIRPIMNETQNPLQQASQFESQRNYQIQG